MKPSMKPRYKPNSFGPVYCISDPKDGGSIAQGRTTANTRGGLGDAKRGPGAPRPFFLPVGGCGAPDEKPARTDDPLWTYQSQLRPSMGDCLRQRWATFFRSWDDLENSWLGDLIGAVCLCVLGYVLIIMAWAFS